MSISKIRNLVIGIFTIAWALLFHYESVRYQFLNPLFQADLPKMKLLFPPAGWIMFYRVDEIEGRAEVYGISGGEPRYIDPHRIFDNRWIGYDNIRRNVLINVLNPRDSGPFCDYLKRKFPEYESFSVMQAIYPSNIQYPNRRVLRVAYDC